jgi:hypothetical protein
MGIRLSISNADSNCVNNENVINDIVDHVIPPPVPIALPNTIIYPVL